MRICVDATTLIGLGTIGELELLTVFDGDLVIPPAVYAEVTTEPARTALSRFRETHGIERQLPTDERSLEEAGRVLGDDTETGDVQLVAAVLAGTAGSVAVVSDDRRVRTTARSLGAPVTGTIGVIVRAVDDGLSADEGKQLIRRLDRHGLHLTGELRDTAFELIEAAGAESS